MATYDIRKIENWLDEFKDCSNQYKNNFYSEFNDSYLNSCSDSVVFKMRKSLAESYEKINDAYTKIDIFWSEFLNELIATDESLAEGKIGHINSDAIINKLRNLPNLDEFSINLNVRLESLLGKYNINEHLNSSKVALDDVKTKASTLKNDAIANIFIKSRLVIQNTKYNYLSLLKNTGIVEKLKVSGKKITPLYNIELDKVDEELEYLKQAVQILKNTKSKNGFILNEEDTLLFEAKEKFKSEPDKNILQSNYFINDINYKFYKKYTNYINTEFENDCKVLSKYISKSEIEKAKSSIVYMSKDVMEAVDRNVAGFNNGANVSFIGIRCDVETVVHESMHHISRKGIITGIHITPKYTGINEGITEYFTKVVLDDQYPNSPYDGYANLRDNIVLLVDEGVLDNDTIAKSYFNNDIKPIKNRINEVAGNDKAFDELVDAFQDCYDTRNPDKLDEECVELIEANSNK